MRYALRVRSVPNLILSQHTLRRYNRTMADRVIHISEDEAASDFAGLMEHVRAGAEVVIESGRLPIAVIHAPLPPRRTISECIGLLAEDSPAVMDADFAKDVEAAIESHREPLTPPSWE
jgi:antitoxin (DNA-binding transcriptional repressor) of toxin-antitoxin stability system